MPNSLRTLFTLSALSSLASLGLFAPGHAKALGALATSAFFTIDDAGLTSGNPNNILASLTASAYSTPQSPASFPGFIGPITIVPESLTTLGSVDATFTYVDTHALSNPITVNFNIFESIGGPLSDTLSMTFTPGTTGTTEAQVALHFFSDNDVLPLSQLTGANTFSITETGAYQDLSSQVASATALQTFHIRFASDVESVPLPSAVWSGAALLSAMGATTIIRRRRRLAVA